MTAWMSWEGVKQALKSMGSALALSVGKMAPEIAGPDIDGVDFNLSDYRGQSRDAGLLGRLVRTLQGYVPTRAVAR